MNHFEQDDLLKELDSLNQDVPPMPKDFHEGWTARLEDETHLKKVNRTALTRILATAAALVFVVGGATLAQRAQKNDMVNGAGQYVLTRGVNMDTGAALMEEVDYEYDDAFEYGVETAAAKSSMAKMPSERMLVRTANLTVSTKTYDESLAALNGLCEASGGWTASVSERASDDGLRTCNLTLRIPAEALDSFLSGTDGLGRVTWRTENAQDVTESYQDTQGRLATQQALMDRLQTLVTSAASLSELLELEVQIAETQYQIDRLQSQLNTTERRVNYATVDITLREESEASAGSSLGAWLTSAFQSGGEAFVGSLENAVVFLAAALPFAAIVAIVWLIVWSIRKRKGR